MSDPEPTIRIAVDLTNPGQFFACCGLLELAGRVDGYATGRFDDRHFQIDATNGRVLEQFFDCAVEVDRKPVPGDEDVDDVEEDSRLNPHRHRIAPMRLLAPFNLRLDWWTDKAAQEQRLKTWSAGQRVTDLLLGHHKKGRRKAYVPSMREHFARAVEKFPDDWLRRVVAIDAPMAFSYDSRLSRNNALDLGHVHGNTFAFSPAVDVLALIGLQRFRPRMVEQWTRNVYFTWRDPLPASVASAVVSGAVDTLVDRCFEFPIKPRDAQGRYKLFGHAQFRRSVNEQRAEKL